MGHAEAKGGTGRLVGGEVREGVEWACTLEGKSEGRWTRLMDAVDLSAAAAQRPKLADPPTSAAGCGWSS